jgi:hypothetical protein
LTPQDEALWKFIRAIRAYAPETIYVLHADGCSEEPEPTGAEKVKALCDLAVIFGMKAEDAEQATFTELAEFVDAHMGIDGREL